jgi:hypothetical protein
MSSQIFKQSISNNLLFNMLDKIAIKTEKKYIFNKNAYKKGLFNNIFEDFLNECKEVYYSSKLKYIERKLSYNKITTIIRQICNFNKITYTSQIKYDKSCYDIEYYIFFK